MITTIDKLQYHDLYGHVSSEYATEQFISLTKTRFGQFLLCYKDLCSGQLHTSTINKDDLSRPINKLGSVLCFEVKESGCWPVAMSNEQLQSRDAGFGLNGRIIMENFSRAQLCWYERFPNLIYPSEMYPDSIHYPKPKPFES